MRPRNDRQRAVVALSAALPPITEAQKRWAIEHVFAKKALLCKGRAWCSICGRTFDAATISPFGVDLLGDTVICPHCGTKLKVEHSRKKKLHEKWYYTIVTTFRGWQVCRNLSVEKEIRQGEKPYFGIYEVVQNWIDEDGHEEVIAKPISTIQGYYDCWAMSKPMELRNAKRVDRYHPDKYRISGAWIYPSRRVLPKAKRNGYTGRNAIGLPESEHIRLLLTDREAEVLEKNGQFSLLGWKYNRGYGKFKMPHHHAIRIAIRNKYLIKDASLWFDYLDLLEYFRLDTHNAYYVCPRNLKAEHDRLLARKQRVEAEIAEERKRKDAHKWEDQYRADKAKYFGICFGNENITIKVIQSVAEMAEEGKTMHHCVYDNAYYKRADTLIMTARDQSGNRIETIEISLKTFSVIQSRAKCNKISQYHDEIISLVSQNIHLIKQAV